MTITATDDDDGDDANDEMGRLGMGKNRKVAAQSCNDSIKGYPPPRALSLSLTPAAFTLHLHYLPSKKNKKNLTQPQSGGVRASKQASKQP